MRLAWGMLVAVVLSACTPPRTPSEQCRRQAAWSRVGRSLGDKSSAAADTLEQLRCDELERDERREAFLARREAELKEEMAQREQRAREEATQRAERAQVARVRRAPEYPELGATPKEARDVCVQQGGGFFASGHNYFCGVGGAPIYAVRFEGDGERVTLVTVHYEGRDPVMHRIEAAKHFGPVQKEFVIDGYRVFAWYLGAAIVTISAYERGSRITFAAAPPKESTQGYTSSF